MQQDPPAFYVIKKKLIQNMYTPVHSYWNQTKFPINKVWWLRETTNWAYVHTPM